MRGSAHALIIAAPLLATASVAQADCTCRARGIVAEHGQTLCIRTPDGYRLARCDKVSNVASWTFLENGCPQIAEAKARISLRRAPGS